MSASVIQSAMYKLSSTLFILVLVACLPVQVQSQVIVSIPPQKEFIEQIAGDHIQVDVMLTPGESPETFSPSPRQLTTLARARVYIQIGVSFERHWTGSLQNLNPDMEIIVCCDQLDTVTENYHRDDVHYWLDPVFVMNYLETILQVLIELQPEQRALFQSNFRAYQNSLRELDQHIHSRLKKRRIDHFIISHSALDAYADRYGLVQLSIENSGRESGPKRLLSIVETARRLNIKTVIDIEQYKTMTVINLAKQLGANITSLDPLVEDYLTNMYKLTDRLVEALGSKE